MKYLKYILIVTALYLPLNTFAQLTAVSGGLIFSSGIDFNTGTTGNPGLFGKAYIKVNKRFHVVPALAAFNKYKRSSFSEVLKTYMFQGDLDAVYGIYKDRSLRFVGFAGINTTYITSKWDILQETPNSVNFKNDTGISPGVNLGGAFQLYVNDSFDAYISLKYIVSSYSQAVINVGAIYYLAGQRRRGGW